MSPSRHGSAIACNVGSAFDQNLVFQQTLPYGFGLLLLGYDSGSNGVMLGR
jgi:hypothetical protein